LNRLIKSKTSDKPINYDHLARVIAKLYKEARCKDEQKRDDCKAG